MTTTMNANEISAVVARAREIAAEPLKGRKSKTPRACACGCTWMTRGGTWYPGHDGIATGVAVRAMRDGRDPVEALANSAARLKAMRNAAQQLAS